MTYLELYQAEWCPHSHRVRQRLTELRVDFVAHQVPAERDERDALAAATGDRSIPVLVDGTTVVSGDDAILAHLAERYAAPDDAPRHRAKAREEVPTFEEVAA